MLDFIWPILIVAALVCGAFSGHLDAVAAATVESARGAVDTTIGLVGMMTLWLGLVRVLEAGGLLQAVARAVAPVTRRLFPEVPPDHPAMGLMLLNISSNMLAITNASTPMGLKAMRELDRLNRHPGVATDAMVLFLAINTANVALFPTEIVALRASLGSTAPGSIVLPTLLATLVSTAVAIVTAKLLAPFFPARPLGTPHGPEDAPGAERVPEEAPVVVMLQRPPVAPWRRLGALTLIALLAASVGCALWERAQGAGGGMAGWADALRTASSSWVLPLLVGLVVLWGWGRGVSVYQEAVAGGREALTIAAQILPYLVAILVAVGMLRASGGFDLLLRGLAPVAAFLHMPAEAIPMGLLRSLSGSGARGLAVELMKTHGPDSFIGNVVSVILGSTETTFYVIAVYYGAVRVRMARHTLVACLLSDAVGVWASVWACRLLLAR